MLRGLYAITDAQLTPDATLLTQVTQALQGGARIIQLRDKMRSDAELYPIAKALRACCTQHQALLIINDRLAVAQAVEADGLHIGQHDLDLQAARHAWPDKILGISCYGDLSRAIRAQTLGADYVAFGACFASPTKPNAPTINLAILRAAKTQLTIPICAIGGITRDNATSLIDCGADMLAVVSDLWRSLDIYRTAQAYQNKFFC